MITQEAIRDHAESVNALVSRFQSQLSREVDFIIADMSATVVASLSRSAGIIDQSPKNSRRILTISSEFERLINSSNYYAIVMAFVSKFSEQVSEFENFHDMTRQTLSIPPMLLYEKDHEVLSNQAAATVAAMEGRIDRTKADLRYLLAKSLGESRATELVKGVSDIIRKTSNVEPMARDQLMSFFRIVGTSVYRNLEASGVPLLYSYVGPLGKTTRDFCEKLVRNGGKFLRREIDDLENGQVPGVFHNGGGWGCQHWWAASAVVG